MDRPPELVLEVLFFLDYASRLRMLLVSRKLHRLVNRNRVVLGLPKVWVPMDYYRTIKTRAVCGAVSAGFVAAGAAAWILTDAWPAAKGDDIDWLWWIVVIGMRYGLCMLIVRLLAGATSRIRQSGR